MPRYPKGVVNRTVPEWNAANLYWGGSVVPSTGSSGGYAGFSLWNSSAGQSLVVWDCEVIFAAPFSAAPLLPVTGITCYASKPFATITYSPLYGYAPHQLGQIPVGQWGTYGAPGGPSGLTQYENINLSNGYWRWNKDFPMITLPPGYAFGIFSFSLSTVFSAQRNNASILFEAVNAPYP